MIPSTHGHFLKSGKVSILKMLPNAVAYFFPSNFLDSGSTASAMCLSSSLLQELTYKGCFSSCIAYIRQGGEREHEDVVAYLGHPYYTLRQQGRCKHVIHPCEEIQPFHRPRSQP